MKEQELEFKDWDGDLPSLRGSYDDWPADGMTRQDIRPERSRPAHPPDPPPGREGFT